MGRSDLAWAAGLFDGEGTVRCKGRYRIVALSMTDESCVRRFAEAVGAGTVSGPDIRPNRKPMWLWWACSANAVVVADVLLPYVDERNRQRLAELIDRYRADKSGVCEYCGKQFERAHRDRRFCGHYCARKSREQISKAI